MTKGVGGRERLREDRYGERTK